jgi:DNA-binding NarL/FixJ family response regulator
MSPWRHSQGDFRMSEPRGSAVLPRVLLIEDDAGFAKSVRQVLNAGLEVATYQTAGEGMRAIETSDAAVGAVIDLWLPDGDGWELLEALAHRHPLKRALILSGHFRLEDLGRAARLRVLATAKEDYREPLVRFGRQCLVEGTLQDGAVRECVLRHADTCSLTIRETLVLVLAIQGLSRKEMQSFCNASESSLKHEIHLLLAKSGEGLSVRVSSLDELASAVLRGPLSPGTSSRSS